MRIKRGADMRIRPGTDMRIKRGVDLRIKRGADLGCFLVKLGLKSFVLDGTDFRWDFSSDLNGLGNYEELLFMLFQIIVSILTVLTQNLYKILC